MEESLGERNWGTNQYVNDSTMHEIGNLNWKCNSPTFTKCVVDYPAASDQHT